MLLFWPSLQPGLPPQAPVIPGSAILIPAALAASFAPTLASWLPAGAVKTLLYRGTRDGMTPLAFHRACDHKNGTLTIVK